MTFVRNVNFVEAIRIGFQKYFQFSGRAQRAEFWWFSLFTTVASLVLSGLDVTIFGVEYWDDDFSPLSDIFSLVILVPSLSIGWRRMHDIGKSGWWSLLWLAPIVWTAVAAVTLFGSDDSYTLVGIFAVIIGIVATIAAFIYYIVLCATDSDPNPNLYGPSPKYDFQNDRF
jgi:uncharacterized membrane protein YhaH (DUF805 family)